VAATSFSSQLEIRKDRRWGWGDLGSLCIFLRGTSPDFCRYNAVTGDWVEDEVLIKMASQVRSHCLSCSLAAKFVISFLLLNGGSKMFSSYRSFEVSNVILFSYLSFSSARPLCCGVPTVFSPQSSVEHSQPFPMSNMRHLFLSL